MPTRPAAVLFDADGVLQYPPQEWRDLVGRTSPGFLPRLLEAERPFLDGSRRDWEPALAEFLAGEPGGITTEDFLGPWHAFRPDPEALAVVREVRAAGVRTVLATNQQACRAEPMHAGRYYDDVMDDQFFSYRLGVLKPDPAYFEAIADALGLDPGELLFVDDTLPNVEAALAVGLRARHKPDSEGPERLRAILVEEGVLPETPGTNETPGTPETTEEKA